MKLRVVFIPHIHDLKLIKKQHIQVLCSQPQAGGSNYSTAG